MQMTTLKSIEQFSILCFPQLSPLYISVYTTVRCCLIHKLDDRFLIQQPVYKPVKFSVSKQHMYTCTSCYLAGMLDVALFQWGDIFRPNEPSVRSAAGEYWILLVHWMLYITEYIPLSKITHWCTASQTSDACNTHSPSSDAYNMHLFLPKSKQPLTKWRTSTVGP